ncbi:hypothetical protein D3C85_1391690 [compost metagenome]
MVASRHLLQGIQLFRPSVQGRRLPLDKKLGAGSRGAVAQALRVTASEDQLHCTEETLVEDFLLVGDQLVYTIGHLYRTALELNHADGDTVEINHQIRAALKATAQGHFFGNGEIIVLRVLPINQMHRFVGLPNGYLYRYAVTQQLVGTQISLIQRDASGINRSHQPLQRC